MPVKRKTVKAKKTVKKKSVSKKPRFNPNLPNAISTDTAKSIISKIKAWCKYHSTIAVDYERWYCGITRNPYKRQNAHKVKNAADTYAWNEYDAKSRRIAEAIETYFHNLGMRDRDTKGGSSHDSKYVYIYKKKPTWFDA